MLLKWRVGTSRLFEHRSVLDIVSNGVIKGLKKKKVEVPIKRWIITLLRARLVETIAGNNKIRLQTTKTALITDHKTAPL